MELLLNLAWLLLIVPAYWVWRGSRISPARRRFSAVQAMFALVCVLVVLFPVISATDDLLAMRPEIEESPSGKRNIRQLPSDKASGWHVTLQTPPALLKNADSFSFAPQFVNQPLGSPVVHSAVLISVAGRSPPTVGLA